MTLTLMENPRLIYKKLSKIDFFFLKQHQNIAREKWKKYKQKAEIMESNGQQRPIYEKHLWKIWTRTFEISKIGVKITKKKINLQNQYF